MFNVGDKVWYAGNEWKVVATASDGTLKIDDGYEEVWVDSEVLRTLPSEEERKKAADRVAALVKTAEEAITEAEKLADEFNIPFTLSIAYGMGGTYQPEGWQDSYSDAGWNSSSSQC